MPSYISCPAEIAKHTIPILNLSDCSLSADQRNNTEIMKPFFRMWKQRHKAHAFVKLGVERCRVERERLLVEGPIEIFLRRRGYLLTKEALSSKAMNAFVVAHRQVLIDLDGVAYKGAQCNWPQPPYYVA